MTGIFFLAEREKDMRITFTGRQTEIKASLKKFVQDKIKKLDRLIGDKFDAHVILSQTRHRYSAEILLRAPSLTLTVDSNTGTEDARSAVQTALAKIEKQARRFKEKRTGRRKRVGKDLIAKRRSLPTKETDGDGKPSVIAMNGFSKKPITQNEAALRVHDSEDLFLVFRNADNLKISVIYKRKDGNLGLIEPDA
ncbi:MAG: ribosome-associated translation inhibitor RaiA [Acidobacteriota bacterium]